MSNYYLDLGAGVESLNGLIGPLSLAAGSGITITPSGGNTLTITATGGGGGGNIASINSDATAAQLLVIGSAGSDFNIVDNGTGTHTFNLPISSATVTGKLSSTDWSTFNSKQNTLTIGNLTDAGTDGITITGGTGSVIGSGTSISQHVADSTHNGYLSSVDWSTFNSKQSALTIGDLTDAGTDGITITGGTGSIIGSGTSISQHVADSTHNGYLSSTDWSTFNSKQTATLANNKFLVGNGSNVATAVTLTGDVTTANTGSATVNFVGGKSAAAVSGAVSDVQFASSAATASAIAKRDGSANVAAVSFVDGLTSAAGAGGTTTLTAGSTKHQVTTGASGQTFQLPAANTLLQVGAEFTFTNDSTAGGVTVRDNGNNLIVSGVNGSRMGVKYSAVSGSTGVWVAEKYIPPNQTWATTLLAHSGRMSITGVNAGSIQLFIQGFTSQSADLINCANSGGTGLFQVTAAGIVGTDTIRSYAGNKSIDVLGRALYASNGTTLTIDYSSSNNALNSILPSQTGNAGKVLTTNGTNTSWGSSAGDVVGPSGATNSALALFDGTTGKIIKDSSIISATGSELDIPGELTVDSIVGQSGSTLTISPSIGADLLFFTDPGSTVFSTNPSGIVTGGNSLPINMELGSGGSAQADDNNGFNVNGGNSASFELDVDSAGDATSNDAANQLSGNATGGSAGGIYHYGSHGGIANVNDNGSGSTSQGGYGSEIGFGTGNGGDATSAGVAGVGGAAIAGSAGAYFLDLSSGGIATTDDTANGSPATGGNASYFSVNFQNGGNAFSGNGLATGGNSSYFEFPGSTAGTATSSNGQANGGNGQECFIETATGGDGISNDLGGSQANGGLAGDLTIQLGSGGNSFSEAGLSVSGDGGNLTIILGAPGTPTTNTGSISQGDQGRFEIQDFNGNPQVQVSDAGLLVPNLLAVDIITDTSTNPAFDLVSRVAFDQTGTQSESWFTNQFTLVDNTIAPTDVTGLTFSASSFGGAWIQYAIDRPGTGVETGTLYLVQDSLGSFSIAKDFKFTNIGAVFTITAGGQVQYTLTNTGTDASMIYAMVRNISI